MLKRPGPPAHFTCDFLLITLYPGLCKGSLAMKLSPGCYEFGLGVQGFNV